MGSWYANVVACGVGLDEVRDWCAAQGESAWLLPVDDDVVVFAERADAGEGDAGEVAAALSAAIGCIAVAASVYDSDVLLLTLDVAGERLDDYVSDGRVLAAIAGVDLPDEDDDADADSLPVPEGGDASVLVGLLGHGDVAVIDALLHDPTVAPRDEDDDEGPSRWVVADDLHAALVEALGLPALSVGWGFRDLEEGIELPDPVAQAALVRVG